MSNLGKDFAKGDFLKSTFDRKKIDPPSHAELMADLSNEISKIGGSVNRPLIIDGDFHRVPEQGKKPSDDAVWYVVRELDNGLIYGNYGNWRTGVHCEWNSRGDARQLSSSERAYIDKARQDVEAKRKIDNEKAASKARQQWQNAEPADHKHPYLIKKGIQPYGIRQIDDDLIVPVFVEGEISSVQRITPTGDKRFLKGGQTRSGYYQIGKFGDRIYIAEGFATGASIHEATGEGVAVAYNAGNLKPVAQALRESSDKRIVIAGDDDRFTNGNPGRSKAEEVLAHVENTSCRFPVFENAEGQPTDFNDLHCREGLHAVREVLLRPNNSEFDAFTFEGDFDPASLPERPWIIMGLLLRGYVTAGIAPPGVGKSTFAAMMAVMVATGWGQSDA
jgi:putative DNA primase/helicase